MLVTAYISVGFGQHDSTINSLLLIIAASDNDTFKVNKLNDLCAEYASILDYDAAKQYAEEAASIAEKKQFTWGIAIAHYNLGIINFKQDNYDEALNHFQFALPASEKMHDQKRIGKNLHFISLIHYYQGNYCEALRALSEELIILEAIGDKKGIAYNYCNAGNIYQEQGKYPDALNHYLQGRKILETIGNTRGVANTYSSIGVIYDLQGNYSKAIDSYLAALKIQEKIGDKPAIALTQTNLAISYKNAGKSEEGLKLLFSSLEFFKDIQDDRRIALCYINIGLNYHEKKNLPEAKKYYDAALDIYLKIGDKNGVSGAYTGLGNIYFDEEKYPESLKAMFNAVNISAEIGNKESVANLKNNIGLAYMAMKNYPAARQSLEEGISLSREVGAMLRIMEGYKILTKLDSVCGAWEEAFQHYELYVLYKDSLFNNENTKKIVQAQMLYEFEKKEDSLRLQQVLTDRNLIQQTLLAQQVQQSLLLKDRELLLTFKEKDLQALEIERKESEYLVQKAEIDRKQDQLSLLSKEGDLQKLALNKQRLTKNYLLGGLCLMALLSFLTYRNYVTSQQLKLQTLRNKIASDLHDDVGSTLSSIAIFSDVAQNQSNEVGPLLQTINESSRKMLDAMGDIVWTINPDNDQFEKIILRMKSFAFDLLGAKNIDFHFVADEHVSQIKLPMEVRKNLYLIFKEATNNLVKYSGADKAYFSIKGEDNYLAMTIKDNGKGFDPDVESSGNGLKNMQKRAEEMGAKLIVLSAPGQGTNIQLKIAV